MERMLRNLRENKLAITKIKKETIDGKIPKGLLLEGEKGISQFKQARQIDKHNDCHPEALMKRNTLKKKS